MQLSKKWLVCLSLAVIGLIGGCSKRTTQITDELLTVPASTGTIRKSITFVGNVTSAQTDSLKWGTSGVIETVYVGIGDSVQEGQVLATLEKDSLSASVLNAEVPFITALEEMEEVYDSETPKAEAYNTLKEKEAALVSAEKYQESLKYPHAVSSEISYWSGQVDIYKQYYDEALDDLNSVISWKKSTNESEYDTYETKRKAMLSALNKYAEVYNTYLYYSHKATDNEIEQAAANIGTAQADYEKALKNFRTYAEYPREKDIAAAQLKLDNAQTTYNKRNIIATVNGVVTEIKAREGDYVTQNTAAFRLDNTSHLYIPLDISEIDITSIYEGMKALIVLDANTSKTYNGVITNVSASGTASGSRVTFETMVEILDPDDNVRIGMTGEVDLILSESENALLVPNNAVFKDDSGTFVTVSNGTSTYDVPVTIGMSTDTVTEISGGYLKEGDLVCVPSIDNSALRDLGLLNSTQKNTPAAGFPEGMEMPQFPSDFSGFPSSANRNED